MVGDWDLMGRGNYNGKGYLPCGYSAHERMFMGWLSPEELTRHNHSDRHFSGRWPAAYLIATMPCQ